MAPTTFTQVYNNLRPGLFESGQHVRGREKEGHEEYYTHDPLVPSGRGSEALKRRTDKYARGAAIVEKALNNEYPPDVVKGVINAVSLRTGRDLYKRVTRGDLDLIHEELNRKPRTFKHFYETYGPGLFGIGQGDYLRTEDAGPGLVRLRTDTPVGSALEKHAKIKARRDGAQLIWKAIARDYGRDRADDVFAQVSRTRPKINEEMTRGDLELLRKELDKKPPTKFSDILEHFAPVLDEKRDEPVRGKIKKDAKAVYLHYQGLLDACWPEDQEWRDKRHKDGATLVRQAIVTQYGEGVATAVLAKVGKDTGGRNLAEEITLGDLALLKQELQRMQQELQRVEAMKGLYDALTKARPDDRSPKVMFERFEQLKAMADDEGKPLFTTVVEPLDGKGCWAFAFKIGDGEIYRSERLQDGPGQYRIEFALRQAIEANQLHAASLDPLAYLLASNIRFMSDNPTQQTLIAGILDDPVFARANFLRIEDVDDNRFRAVFRGEDGERLTLEFSNRMSTMGEMRGKTLRDALEDRPYAMLRDIAAPAHLSNDDILKQAFANMWVNVAATMGFENGAALTDYLAKLPRGEWNAVDDILSDLAFGSTSLAALYLPMPAPAEAQAEEDAELDKQAIITQYGEDVANHALAVVSRDVGHDIEEKTTLADLKLLEQELPRQQQRYQAMQQRYQELEDAIKSGGSPKAMFDAFEQFTARVDDRRKDRFTAVVEPLDDKKRWAFAFKIGDAEVYRSARLQDGPGQHRDEFARRAQRNLAERL